MTDPILQIQEVSVRYDAFCAVDRASLQLERGSITGLIGPNGAGKSTLFNCITGEKRVAEGRIRFAGRRIDHLAPDQVYHAGLARTFQIPRPFPEMTVFDNLMVGAPHQIGEKFWAPILMPGRVEDKEEELRAMARDVLAFTTLDRVSSEAAGNLSGGQQKLLELARVLMGSPRLILLDEPAAGVNPSLVQLLIEKIKALNEQGITFLIVEHDMDLIMRHCDPIIAMANGRVIFEGNSTQAKSDPALLDAYMGDAHAL